MIVRGFLDHLPLWPYAIWPVLASSIIINLRYFNHAILYRQGITFYELYKIPTIRIIYSSIFFVSRLLEPVILLYSLWIFGWIFLIWIFLGLFTFRLANYFIVGFLPFSHFIMPMVYVFVVLSYSVLLGFVHIAPIEKFNIETILLFAKQDFIFQPRF